MYPYNYVSTVRSLNHQEIFVVMPFSTEFDALYEQLIKKAVQKANDFLNFGHDRDKLNPYRTKDDTRTVSGWLNILEHLTKARIVIGVLDSDNPNVFYELGIAHTFQPIQRQVLIAKQGYKPRFDLKDLIYFQYQEPLSESIDGLAIKIEDAIKSQQIEKERRISQARMSISPMGFSVITVFGGQQNFAFSLKSEFKKNHIKNYGTMVGDEIFNYHATGISNLCQCGLLVLNTKTVQTKNQGPKIEFSYWWTDLGNEVLVHMKLISQEELNKRRRVIPEQFLHGLV